jgi:hypothetical protein
VSAPPQVETIQAQPQADGDDVDTASVSSQVLFRRLNEEIRRLADGFVLDDTLELVCECEHADCFAPISVSRDAYEAIRRFPTRFLIKSEHLSADDRVVQETAVFAVVEKVGPGAETAILLDPRKRASGKPASSSADRRRSIGTE